MGYRSESTAWGDYNDPRSNLGWEDAISSGRLRSDYTQEEIEGLDAQSEFRQTLSPGQEFEAYLTSDDYRNYKRSGKHWSKTSSNLMAMVAGTGSEQRRINELISSGGSMEDVNQSAARGYMGDLGWVLSNRSDPNRTEQETKMATWRLKDIEDKLPSGKAEEFRSLVDAYGGVFSEGNRRQGTGNDPSYSKLNDFLKENVRYSRSIGYFGPKTELQPRRIDDNAFDAMVQSATKNDYNVGE